MFCYLEKNLYDFKYVIESLFILIKKFKFWFVLIHITFQYLRTGCKFMSLFSLKHSNLPKLIPPVTPDLYLSTSNPQPPFKDLEKSILNLPVWSLPKLAPVASNTNNYQLLFANTSNLLLPFNTFLLLPRVPSSRLHFHLGLGPSSCTGT